jgi:hypothetical protein
LCGCATKRWDVFAYDLSGKQIWKGTVITGDGPWRTSEGKEISFLNATLVMVESRGDGVVPPKPTRPVRPQIEEDAE